LNSSPFTFEQAVLLAIVRLGAEAYGRTILHQVQQSLKRNVSAGSVYTTLDRLESRRLIRSQLAAGTPARGGRARRYCAVNTIGMRALNDAHRTMTAMWATVEWPVKVPQ
jgi:PadR family transcriptional regulator, regulatory protein PadR